MSLLVCSSRILLSCCLVTPSSLWSFTAHVVTAVEWVNCLKYSVWFLPCHMKFTALDIKKQKKTIILFTGNLSRVHVTVLVPLRDLAAFLWWGALLFLKKTLWLSFPARLSFFFFPHQAAHPHIFFTSHLTVGNATDAHWMLTFLKLKEEPACSLTDGTASKYKAIQQRLIGGSRASGQRRRTAVGHKEEIWGRRCTTGISVT